MPYRRSLAFAALAAALLAPPVHAQHPAPVAARLAPPSVASVAGGRAGAPADGTRRRASGTRTDVVAARVTMATVGFVVGAYVGARTAARLIDYDCQCDDPGLVQALYGGMAVGTLGAALGAAAPADGGCSFGRRLGPALAGAAVGTAGAFVALYADIGGPWPLLVLPVIGAVVARPRCTTAR